MLARELDHTQVQWILEGQSIYWDLLYQKAYTAVVRCAERADPHKLLTQDDYEDIADEAFARCFADLPKYEGRSQFAYWVGGYVKNIVKDRYEKEYTRRRNMVFLKTAAKQHILNNEPILVLLHRETRKCIWNAFDTLAPTDQDILELRVLRKMTFRETAEQLRLSRKEVIRRYSTAIRQLRTRYQAYKRASIWR